MTEKRLFQVDFLTALFRDPLDPAYAQAAAHRRNRPPLPLWRRLIRKTVAFIVLAVIGFLFTVAYRQVVMDAPEREKVRAGLISRINQQKDSTTELEKTAEGLQDEVTTLREALLSDPATIEQLRQMEAATGMRRVSGDGVVVRIADGPDAAANEKARVLDFDLKHIANTLWVLGAEAISINGRRLTSLTTIRRAGAMYVGDFPVTGPYEISAIGPPDLHDKFAKSLTAKFYRDLQDRPEHRFGFKVTKADGLELPAAVLPELRSAKVPTPTVSPTPSGGGK